MVIFKNAIPYDETIARLNTEFSLQPGDLYTHEQLRACVQPDSDARYRGVLSSWMRRLWREKGIRLSGEGRARGIGVMVCLASEHSALEVNHLFQGARKIKRSAKGLDRVDVQALGPDQLVRHNIARQLAHALSSETSRLKDIPAPQAVKAHNVRMFKKA